MLALRPYPALNCRNPIGWSHPIKKKVSEPAPDTSVVFLVDSAVFFSGDEERTDMNARDVNEGGAGRCDEDRLMGREVGKINVEERKM